MQVGTVSMQVVVPDRSLSNCISALSAVAMKPQLDTADCVTDTIDVDLADW